MEPTSRVPGFGPRLELGLAGFCSTGQGIERAGVKLTPLRWRQCSLPGFSRVEFLWRWRTVNPMSEVLK